VGVVLVVVVVHGGGPRRTLSEGGGGRRGMYAARGMVLTSPTKAGSSCWNPVAMCRIAYRMVAPGPFGPTGERPFDERPGRPRQPCTDRISETIHTQ